jgi:hypothetical protein
MTNHVFRGGGLYISRTAGISRTVGIAFARPSAPQQWMMGALPVSRSVAGRPRSITTKCGGSRVMWYDHGGGSGAWRNDDSGCPFSRGIVAYTSAEDHS